MLRNLAHMLFITSAPRHRMRVVEEKGQMLPVLECMRAARAQSRGGAGTT